MHASARQENGVESCEFFWPLMQNPGSSLYIFPMSLVIPVLFQNFLENCGIPIKLLAAAMLRTVIL
jgi:hypothetical protein